MKGGNEQKHNIINHLLNSTLKSQQAKEKSRPKSPVHKFQYQLPASFFEAVDDARIEAGYDILPRFHHLSVSPTHHHQASSSLSHSRRSKKHHHHHHHSHRQTGSKHHHHRHSHHKNGLKHSHSSSTSDSDNDSPKKVRFRRTARKHSHHHKDTTPSSSRRSSSQKRTSSKSHSSLNIPKASLPIDL